MKKKLQNIKESILRSFVNNQGYIEAEQKLKSSYESAINKRQQNEGNIALLKAKIEHAKAIGNVKLLQELCDELVSATDELNRRKKDEMTSKRQYEDIVLRHKQAQEVVPDKPLTAQDVRYKGKGK